MCLWIPQGEVLQAAGRSASGRKAPMGQFQLPTVQVVTQRNRAFDSVANEADSPHGSGQPICPGTNRTDLTLECCR